MLAALSRWSISRMNALTAFLQTGKEEKFVYVIPYQECKERRLVLLLIAAFQILKYSLMKKLSILGSLSVSSSLRYFSKTNKTCCSWLLRRSSKTSHSLPTISSPFSVAGSILVPLRKDLGACRYSAFLYVNTKRTHLILMEMKSSMHLNPPICPRLKTQKTATSEWAGEVLIYKCEQLLVWLGITASALCAFYRSYLKQKIHSNKCSFLALHSRCLAVDSSSTCAGPSVDIPFSISVCVFVDYGQCTDNG